jgi:2-haloacid dehalogenase
MTSAMEMPQLLVFDVNETLSDLSPLVQRFADVGAPDRAADQWFAGVLRDGFALAAVGEWARFEVLAAQSCREVLADIGDNWQLENAIAHVLGGFGELDVHADVVSGVTVLKAAGFRLVTLSNGASRVAETLLSGAGIRDAFEKVLSVEDVGAWKPSSLVYEYALDECGVAASDAVMVAVHPWDLHGAAKVGMRTAWINRRGATYPTTFREPDYEVGAVAELAGCFGDAITRRLVGAEARRPTHRRTSAETPPRIRTPG